MAIPEGGTYNLVIKARAGFAEVFWATEDDEVTPIDFLAGTTGVAQVRDEDGALLLELAVNVGAPDPNAVTVSATGAATAAMDRDGDWDLLITEPGSEPVRFLEGRALLDPGVSVAP